MHSGAVALVNEGAEKNDRYQTLGSDEKSPYKGSVQGTDRVVLPSGER